MAIENHTLTHPDLRTLGLEDRKAEICGASKAIGKNIGTKPELLRPPFGSYNAATLTAAQQCGLRAVVLWTASGADQRADRLPGPGQEALSGRHPAAALPAAAGEGLTRLVRKIEKRGFSFGDLGAYLDDLLPAASWSHPRGSTGRSAWRRTPRRVPVRQMCDEGNPVRTGRASLSPGTPRRGSLGDATGVVSTGIRRLGELRIPVLPRHVTKIAVLTGLRALQPVVLLEVELHPAELTRSGGDMEALDLARWQFGITTVYHFLFVPLTIGLGVFVAGLQTAWYRTGKEHYLTLTKFFGKLFLINFAMGVVTGIVQEFQFGMNWSEYSIFVGDVFGAPLAMEALLAFFLESTFLGLWIFGWDKLPKKVHLATIWAAVIGSNLSAYFILAANAWMKHPVGYEVVDGKARMTDLWAVLTNSTALAQVPTWWPGRSWWRAGSCWRWPATGSSGSATRPAAPRRRRQDHPDAETPTDMWRTALRGALVMTAIAGAVVALTGDMSGQLLHTQQPMKLAAAEGLRHDTAGAPFSPVPGIEVPNMLSLLAAHDPNATIQGIDDINRRLAAQFGPGDYTPNLPVVYLSFRVMIVFGMATVGLAFLGLFLTRGRGRKRDADGRGPARLAPGRGPPGADLVRPAVRCWRCRCRSRRSSPDGC